MLGTDVGDRSRPAGDFCPDGVEIEKQKFVSHAIVEALTEAVMHGLSRRDENAMRSCCTPPQSDFG